MPETCRIGGRFRAGTAPKGNDFRQRRAQAPPQNPIEVLGRITSDLISRVSVREYLVDQVESGSAKRRLKRLDASSANAAANLIRVKLDLLAQGAGEEMLKITAELEQLREIVGGMLEARGV